MEKMISFFPINHWQSEPNPKTLDVEGFFEHRFDKKKCLLYPYGRNALDDLLCGLRLRRNDEVWILTTFDLPNVSSCVTSTIFNYCKPSRVYSAHTRVILIIHEFGVPHPNLYELSEFADNRELIFIEDCAHTIDSWIDGKCVGSVGRWTMISFSKLFPLNSGGALIGPDFYYSQHRWKKFNVSGIRNDVSSHLQRISDYSKQRRRIFSQLATLIKPYGLSPLYEINEKISPWFFPVPVPDVDAMLNAAVQAQVDCALWHGTNIVVFPCHQYLNEKHFTRIVKVIEQGLERSS